MNGDKVYRTNHEFRVALEKATGRAIPPSLWPILHNFLDSQGVHEPFTDADVEFAIKKCKRLGGIVK